MPGARDRFKQVCIAGHIALMAICSQHFLVKAARMQEAGDPDHMKWLEASYGHMVAIRNLGQAYQIRQCMGQQGWSLNVGAFHRYTETWIGREAQGTAPQAAFLNGKVDPWQMLFTKPMHHDSESRAAALPDRRVCVPFKDPACWKRKSLLLIETCEHCCNPFEHKSGRGASWCWDDEWTYERCCQQDYKDLVCEVRRKGEEGGCVDCKKSVTYVCMTPPEKRLQDAQNNYNTKVDLFNSLQDKAKTLATDIAATRSDLVNKDGIYRNLHADLNAKLQIWHRAFNNASRLSSAARLEQQDATWNNSNSALQEAQGVLRASQAATSSAQAALSEARRLEQLGSQLLANNESSYNKAKSHHAATEKALTLSQQKQQAAESATTEAEEALKAAAQAAEAALETSESANTSCDATYFSTHRELEEAESARDLLRAQALKTVSDQQVATALHSFSHAQAARACYHRAAIDTASAGARVRSAQHLVNEAQAARNRTAEALNAARKDEDLVQQAIFNCTIGSRGSSASQCLIASTPANKSAKPLTIKSSWQKDLCTSWQGCDAGGCACSDCEAETGYMEPEINSLTRRLQESQRFATEVLKSKREFEPDEDAVYVPPELVTASEKAAEQVSLAREAHAMAGKASKDAESSLTRLKADREAIGKKHLAAPTKLKEARNREKELSSELSSVQAHLRRNVTALEQMKHRLVEANETALRTAVLVQEAISREAASKEMLANLTQEAERQKRNEQLEAQRKAEAEKHVQSLNQSLADNLTVLVSAWLRQQETAGQVPAMLPCLCTRSVRVLCVLDMCR